MRKKTKELLLDAARDALIENQGDIEILHVSTRAEVSVGSVYHHFGSKSGLLSEVVAHFYEPLLFIASEKPSLTQAHWVDGERQRLEKYVKCILSDPISPFIYGNFSKDCDVTKIENDYLNKIIAMGTEHLATAINIGLLKASFSPRLAIAFLVGGLHQLLKEQLLSDVPLDQSEVISSSWYFAQRSLGLP